MSLMLENKNGNGDKSGAFSPAAIMAMQHMWQGEHTSDEQVSHLTHSIYNIWFCC